MKEKRVREEFVLPLNRINNMRQHHSCENEALSIERAKQNPTSRRGAYRPPVGILDRQHGASIPPAGRNHASKLFRRYVNSSKYTLH